jgi:hypothetical protein
MLNLATTLKTETVIERNAICESETALESAMDGQASPPPPPSRFMYMTASEKSLREQTFIADPVDHS